MDSGLEAFLREHKNSPKPVARGLSKQFKYAENLANTIVSKREELEARSNLFNQGPMTVSGTRVPTQTTEGLEISRVVPTEHPGLQVMRAHVLKRGFPGEWRAELRKEKKPLERPLLAPEEPPPPEEPPLPPPEEPPPPEDESEESDSALREAKAYFKKYIKELGDPPPPLSEEERRRAEERRREELRREAEQERERRRLEAAKAAEERTKAYEAKIGKEPGSEPDEDVVSVSSEEEGVAAPRTPAEEAAEEAAHVAAAARGEGPYRRYDTDDEDLPELSPEYQPGGEKYKPFKITEGRHPPTPEERDKLARWYTYRDQIKVANPQLLSARHVRAEFRKQAKEVNPDTKKTGAYGGTFAGFNLNDMLYRGRLIDAGLSDRNATTALHNIKEFSKGPNYLPPWPEGAPMPPNFEFQLERQERNKERREQAKAKKAAKEAEEAKKKEKKAKASPKSTARSSRG